MKEISEQDKLGSNKKTPYLSRNQGTFLRPQMTIFIQCHDCIRQIRCGEETLCALNSVKFLLVVIAFIPLKFVWRPKTNSHDPRLLLSASLSVLPNAEMANAEFPITANA